MARDPLFKHLMQELFPSYVVTLDLGPYNIVNYQPKGPLTKNLLNMFPKVIAVLENIIMESWSEYIYGNRELMLSSAEMYVSHMMVISSIEERMVNDILDKFLVMLTLVTYIPEMINIATGMNFCELTPHILTVFFENVLREDFNKSDGWKHLEKHIQSKKYNEYYKECTALNFAIDEILEQKIREMISPRRPLFSFGISLKEVVKHPLIVDLTCQVMSSVRVETALLNEPSLLKLDEESDSVPVEESDSVPVEESDSVPVEESDSDVSVVTLKRVVVNGSDSGLEDCGLVDFNEFDHVSNLEISEEKIRHLISIFELLDTE